MKVALCFIISYNHVVEKESYWIEWIQSNTDLFNVYFHYKNKKKIKSAWILKHCLPEKYIQYTSYFNVVPAYISLLSYAYTHDSSNQWFCMLTDSCVPIISPTKFRELFFNNCNKSIIRCAPANWNVDYHTRANLKYFSNEFRLANDPWFTLCRDHVYLCTLFIEKNRKIYDIINNGGLANESMFAIILQTFREINTNNVLNTSATLSDWFRMSTPTSPHLFNECTKEDEIIIRDLLKKNKYALFFRKVSSRFPDEKLKELSGIDVGHKYPNNKYPNNKYTNNKYTNNKYTNNKYNCNNYLVIIFLIIFLIIIVFNYVYFFLMQ